MKRIKITLIALAVMISIVCVLNTAISAFVTEVCPDHDCSGCNCIICYIISRNFEHVGSKTVSTYIPVLLFAASLMLWLTSDHTYFLRSDSPVKLKVKFLN